MEREVDYVKIFFSIVALLVMSFCIVAISAKYRIWGSEQHGKAELAQAEYSRKIWICEAEAKKESAKHEAEAETIRAHGVAEANAIIGESLKGNESYLRYRWIEGLQTNQMQVIYLPTEAGLPILEANRMGEYKRCSE